MSQVLKGGASGAGSVPPKSTGNGKSGFSMNMMSSNVKILSSPTPGMPGVLPGSILTGHNHKSPSAATAGETAATPIVGSGANMTSVAVSVQHQANSVVSPGGQQQPQGQTVAATPASSNQGNGATPALSNNSSLANTKEKTPMCLINELARFNKVQHQYTLTDEQGPAHKKIFYVKLKLGNEEYDADGPSIKKAQHAAAAIALECSQYKHPPPKPPRTNSAGNSVTPTVELNALSMKRGEVVMYKPLEIPRAPFIPVGTVEIVCPPRYHHPRYPRTFYVSLKVGQREFIGEGNTRQSARHNAAEKALKVLSVLPITSEETFKIPDTPKEVPVDDSEEDDPLKSEISVVHEIALKRNLHVNFEVTKESGPPHMKVFVTRCTCGTINTDGEGNSKKLSKKRAAEKMLEELTKLPPVNAPVTKPKKNPNKKKNTRNLIKKADPDYGVGINPISRLIQIQQAKKEKEPIYSLIAEKGMPRRKEFVMQVTVGEQTCTGVGPNKKLAKRNAAEAMLQVLGYSRPAPQPSKPAIKSGDTTSPSADKKVTFLDTESHHSRQLVPGVLMIPDAPRAAQAGVGQGSYMQPLGGMGRVPGAPTYTPSMGEAMGIKYSPQTTAAIAKELLDTGASPTAEAIDKSGAKTAVSQSVVRPKQQLYYLAEVLGFQVQFTDFPKSGKKSEYLSLVSLSTNPPQVSHGSGTTIDTSHDIAALNALKALSDMGLESVSDTNRENGNQLGGGDGTHIKIEKEA